MPQGESRLPACTPKSWLHAGGGDQARKKTRGGARQKPALKDAKQMARGAPALPGAHAPAARKLGGARQPRSPARPRAPNPGRSRPEARLPGAPHRVRTDVPTGSRFPGSGARAGAGRGRPSRGSQLREVQRPPPQVCPWSRSPPRVETAPGRPLTLPGRRSCAPGPTRTSQTHSLCPPSSPRMRGGAVWRLHQSEPHLGWGGAGPRPPPIAARLLRAVAREPLRDAARRSSGSGVRSRSLGGRLL